ncbi:hypothetical protein C1X05_14670 [Laceyella sacchari]|jgi:hypothetical protein|uniref:Uncharacterized protein n=1 Tax=Laceyella sacchari TaxID=37482 RepID=A0ABY5U3U1_LACSH|nr:hypothetical protein [Laceyella sacchari]KPC72484.1 hypothetical protein ADL26_14075 [Thermoactinomyces vulgaris]MRG29562.1 hypothetical protein [Laceyella tengchongensis]AUS09946.1 hypothetical protein C1X05_14670 [Laceyella sacchari]TCW38969.1 hypothetical protein EDC32_102209 [Laceyella sacchari]UWE03305.1 hypothetical protein NYR52_14485 [Laceyella sacchari]
MVEVKYRIIEDIDELKTLDRDSFDRWGEIEGFFMIRFNDKFYCNTTYHENELRPGEEGFDLITIWFDHFLQAVKLLEKHDYVAVRDIETPDVFIEFKKLDKSDYIYAGAIFVHSKNTLDIRDAVVTTSLPYQGYEFINEKIAYKDLKEEILKKSFQYIKELEQINQELIFSRRIQRLTAKINQIRD